MKNFQMLLCVQHCIYHCDAHEEILIKAPGSELMEKLCVKITTRIW